VADVFISYKREDEAVASQLQETLLDLGVDVWIDRKLKPSTEFEPEIVRQLGLSRAVLVLWSDLSLHSEWVCKEAAVALDEGKYLPIRISRSAAPPREFSRFHAPDMSDWSGQLAHSEWLIVLDSLEVHLGRDNLVSQSKARSPAQAEFVVPILRQMLLEHAATPNPLVVYPDALAGLLAKFQQANVSVPHFDQPALWQALDAVSEINRRAGEPPLAALVVNARDRLPSSGFWRKHAFLLDYHSKENFELAQQLHAHYLARIQKHAW